MSGENQVTVHALTLKSTGIARVISCSVEIFQPNNSIPERIMAIWDTGATATVITKKVVDALGLVPTGVVTNNTANGPVNCNTYIINIGLPNKLTIEGIVVSEVSALSGADALIGMDIIGLGDFSLTNHQGRTCMSFRIPSLHEIDYVRSPDFLLKSVPDPPAIRIGRNDPCFCNSGKKYKACHGKNNF